MDARQLLKTIGKIVIPRAFREILDEEITRKQA
jgi:hypothetical protein